MITTGRTARVTEAPAPPARFAWIYGPGTDLFVALCWVPVFLATHALTVRHGAGNDHLLGMVFDSAFLLSLVHQPLTLALVYGDRNQFALRRRLFTWSPIVTVALVSVAVLLNLWIIIPIGAIWNTVHTLQQRYGLSRIYGRKAGYGAARLDRVVLYAWMAAAILAVGASRETLRLLGRVMLDAQNADAIKALAAARHVALWLLAPAVVVAVAATAALVRQEVHHLHEANRAKWFYQGSSIVLIAAIAFDPLAGFTAFVAAHAIEYIVVVERTMRSRYGRRPDRSTFLGRVTSAWSSRLAFLAVFMGAFFLLDAKLDAAAPRHVYDITLYSVGILHFWYDGFIWKLRRPAVAATFDLPTTAARDRA